MGGRVVEAALWGSRGPPGLTPLRRRSPYWTIIPSAGPSISEVANKGPLGGTSPPQAAVARAPMARPTSCI
eukprot:11205883-Lingulodinium_polyedra.AAC.1